MLFASALIATSVATSIDHKKWNIRLNNKLVVDRRRDL
jgi:hypothetical protein